MTRLLTRRTLLLNAVAGAVALPFQPLLAAADGPSVPLVFVTHASNDKRANAPILFFMHGFGSDENDLIALASSLPPTLTVVSFRAPYAAPNGGYQWYDNQASNAEIGEQITRSRTAVETSISQLVEHFHADPLRVFVGGFSQGANLTYALTLSRPDRYRGGLVFSGKILPSVAAMLDPATDVSHLSLFIGHGRADTVIPFAYADNAAMTLRARKVDMTFNSYAGMQHEISQQELSDAATWLTTRL